ncbi:hypothetical protein A2V68_00465 [candidate division Kazan bacterium RBG_13_50_9]|uniref:2'-deoxycytidine 5'-triphosphate deaminase n=1 Tax=candidate division Kazan bacterium RBG_13_50_9 TaxID=1798535 RepID=A0A1F4NSH4_UNCK3|nr:MAG: hypothetical protein A2V68_00465 [candidate division Kazan bacterium RBG_13_50_9]
MAPIRVGALLPDFLIKQLIADGHLGIPEDDVSACSVDLRVGTKVLQIRGLPDLAGGFNPSVFASSCYNKFSSSQIQKGITLTSGPNTYMIELDVQLNLPPGVWMETDARSSTGRIDVQCQVLGLGSTRVNRIPPGSKGSKPYLFVTSGSFAITIKSGDSLVQARLFEGERAHLSNVELRRLHAEHGIIENHDVEPVIEDGALVLHLDLSKDPPGFSAIDEGQTLVIGESGTCDPTRYFRPKPVEPDGRMRLAPGEFILVATRERVRIPPLTAGALRAYQDEHGEYRAHLASWFERGFGFGLEGECSGNVAVCEIRNKSMAPIFMSDGQALGKLTYEYLACEPEQVYGAYRADGQYLDQKVILLPRFFTPWPVASAQAS